jgi:hypothetical protein
MHEDKTSHREYNRTIHSLGLEQEDKGNIVVLVEFHKLQRGRLLENMLALMSRLEEGLKKILEAEKIDDDVST